MKYFDEPDTLEARSRFVVERLALAVQAAILVKAGNAAVADAFCESRLGTAHGNAFGTLSTKVNHGALIERALA